MEPLICVIYDSILNSVFVSQVLQPLLQQKQHHPERIIYLVSFEPHQISKNTIAHLIPPSSGIIVHIHQRIPFIGIIGLRYAAYYLKKILMPFQHYELRARGPLAGLLCLYARNKHCTALTIQARGLLAAEYEYTNLYEQSMLNPLKRWWYYYRTKQYYHVEQLVYGLYFQHMPFIIESVSPALKEYLITTFGTPSEKIIIAELDTVPPISIEQKQLWRAAQRAQLHISDTIHIYCYSGSAKAWQCPEEVILFFKKQYTKNNNIFLLILTTDIAPFKLLLSKHAIPSLTYHLTTSSPNDVLRYLAAADTGIIFRKPHSMNWVSRPTKALEYRAAGLHIIHNNTIAYLTESSYETI